MGFDCDGKCRDCDELNEGFFGGKWAEIEGEEDELGIGQPGDEDGGGGDGEGGGEEEG